MKAYVKVLSALVTVTELVVYGLFALSIFTIVTSFAGTITPVGDKQAFNMEVSPSGETVFSIKVRNQGLLDTTMRFNLQLVMQGETIELGDSITLKPGEEGDMKLRVSLTKEQMLRLITQRPRLFIKIEGRTLEERVGISVKTEVGGGQ